MFRELNAPVSLQIEMTERCTHQCRYCYNYFRHDHAPCHTLGRDDLAILVDEVVKNNVGQVTITGGEPLIAADNVLWLAHQLSSYPWVRLGFNSNLILFTEELGKKLQQAGINSVLTSLIADDPEIHDKVAECPGSWEKTVEAIKLAKKLGFRVMANMVLTKWNIGRVYQTGKLAVELGVDKFGATRACAPTPIVNTFRENLISVNELRQSLGTLYQLREKFGCEVDVFEHYPWCALQDIEKYQYLSRRKCTAGVTSATIGANGQLRPCGHSPREYGSVLEHGLRVTWAKMSDWRQQQYVGDICRQCKYLQYCTGGCAVEAENSGEWCDHHCVGESGITQLPEVSVNPKPALSLDEQLSIPPHTTFRREKFGGVMITGNGGFALLDERSYQAMERLFNGESFTARQLIEVGGFEEEETLATLSTCIGKNLIKKGGE